MRSKIKTIGITIGDPAGIGPEITAKALSTLPSHSPNQFIVIGNADILKHYKFKLSRNIQLLDPVNIPLNKISIGKADKLSGKTSLAYLSCAVELLKTKKISALVTSPVHKEAVSLSDPHFNGHTEYLAESFNVQNAGMMFVAPKMKTVIVTRHLPIAKISKVITADLVLKTIVLTHDALKKYFKIKNPSIGICGLNPHAGEGGTIGTEEIKKIIPALKKAAAMGIRTQGPFAADTIFAINKSSSFDTLIAMYHDQGLIPIKTLYFDQLVNLTIGLPFVRTSPAHGTALDIAGKNKADPSSMIAAIKLALRLS